MVIFVVWLVALTPTWLYLGIRFLLGPEGFWQNLVLFGIGALILGSLQFVLFLFGLFITWGVLDDPKL